MHSHIAIEVNGHTMTLPQDQSLDINEQNPMFGEVEMHSYPVQLPFDHNRAVFKNLEARDSSLRAADVDNANARIIVDGLPLRTSVLHVQEGEVLKDSIAVNFDSRTKSFKDMIANMRCRDVEVDDDILIGEKIGDITATYRYSSKYRFIGNGTKVNNAYMELDDYNYKTISGSFSPQATGFSYPGTCKSKSITDPFIAEIEGVKDFGGGHVVNVPKVEQSFINVSKPYPQAKYCNARVCYAHHGIDDEGKTTSDIVESNNANPAVAADYSPYWVLDADRPASGICFYVGYFLERLFKQLGVVADIHALTDIEDFNYLAFFTTECHYRTTIRPFSILSSVEKINEWLSSRGCGGKIAFAFDSNFDNSETSVEQASLKAFNMSTGQFENITWGIGDYLDYRFVGGADKGSSWSDQIKYIYRVPVMDLQNSTATANIHRMYATSDNFPDVNVSEVIESIENAFGVRFHYDIESNKVTAYLLRDIFRSTKAPIHLQGQVLSMYKMTEKITGVRVKYSAESDVDEQYRNIRYGVRDYDTSFDYIEYPEGRTVLDKTYAEIARKVDSGDMNVYVIPDTGNAIRVKVDADASTAKELRPANFEVGQFKGIEVGDCSRQAEEDDTIHEITVGFTPIVANDVAYKKDKGSTNPNYQPLLVPFIDEDMEHEFVEQTIQNVLTTEYCDVYFNYVLSHYESYNPSNTDDGQSPLQHHDWGLTLAILRTGDGGAGVENYDANYDGFGNYRWRDIADNYCMASDTMDQTGRWLGKTDPAKTFSLKIRAWKPFVYYVDDNGKTHISKDTNLAGQEVVVDSTPIGKVWLIPCVDDSRSQSGLITRRIRSRGFADTFLPEYIHFLLYRQKYEVKALVEIAQLADIPNHWRDRYEIDGKIGWINKTSYSATAQKGIGEVTMEFFAV